MTVAGQQTPPEVAALRSEVARLKTLLLTENVGLAVGILMVHRSCGPREALAALVGAALDEERSIIEQADLLVARCEPDVSVTAGTTAPATP